MNLNLRIGMLDSSRTGLMGVIKDLKAKKSDGFSDRNGITELLATYSFYINDNNYYMGNQIFDPGSDNKFEIPDFGNGSIFPPFALTQQQYNNLITKAI